MGGCRCVCVGVGGWVCSTFISVTFCVTDTWPEVTGEKRVSCSLQFRVIKGRQGEHSKDGLGWDSREL